MVGVNRYTQASCRIYKIFGAKCIFTLCALLSVSLSVDSTPQNDMEKTISRVSDPLELGPYFNMTPGTSMTPGYIATIESDLPGDPLGPMDFNQLFQADVLSSGERDPIEMAGLFQGDIQLTSRDDIAEMSMLGETVSVLRNAVIDQDRRWVNGVIPYVISKSYTPEERSIVAQAMKEYHNKTCIRFVPRSNEADYIHILKGNGCSSVVGKSGGPQLISLGQGCLFVGVVMHELMHAAGFWHEQSRADRDEYIQIMWDNIQTGMEYNFKKYNWTEIRNLSVKYDPKSIMHYGPYAFAKDREKPTIISYSLDPIGQRMGFSLLDTVKLRKLYECDGVKFTNSIINVQDVVEEKCADYSTNCVLWANQGECGKNPLWMKANCRKSCHQCNAVCDDWHKFCSDWAKLGECTSNPPYMLQFCKKSCGVCDPQPQAPKDDSRCNDKNMHCLAWAEGGHCKSNLSYMVVLCKKACGFCF